MRTRSNTSKSRAFSSSTSVQSTPPARATGKTTTLDNDIPISIDSAALLERITELEEIVSTLLAWIKEKLPDSVNDDQLRGIIRRFITPNPIGLFNSEQKQREQPKPKHHKPQTQTSAECRTYLDAETDKFTQSPVPSPHRLDEPDIHCEAALLPTQDTTVSHNDSEDIVIKVEPFDDDDFIMEMEMQGAHSLDEPRNITSSTDTDKSPVPSTSQISSDHACTHCAKIFESEPVLARHLKVFHSSNSRIHICAVCGKTFENANSLEDHIVFESHGQAKMGARLQCTFCFRSYKNPEALAKHTQVHLNKPQSEKCRCPICGCMLCDKGTVKSHIREVHRGVRKYKCTLCPRTYKKGSHLKRHKEAHGRRAAKLKEMEAKGPKVRKKTVNKKTPCACEHCGQTFNWKSSLTSHILVHHTPNATDFHRHMCSYCGMTFLLESRLQEHMNTHTDNRPYQCKYCPSKFRQKQSLRAHQHRHLASVKPNKGQHECPICGNILASKNSLQGHIKRVHEGVRRFPCHICTLRFKTGEHLKQHLAAHAKGARPRPLGKPGRKIRPGGFRLLAQVDPASAEQEPSVEAVDANREQNTNLVNEVANLLVD